MKLYRATKKKVDIIEPQEVHSSDFHKFPDDKRPDKVVWATRTKEESLMHGLMDGESYSMQINLKGSSPPDSQYASAWLQSEKPLVELFRGKTDEKIYIYEFDDDGFTQVDDGPEYYREEEIKIFTTKEYTVAEILNILRESNVEFRVKTQLPSEDQLGVKHV